MIIFHTAGDLSAHLGQLRSQGLRTGFVPTMGALHSGHLSLVRKAGEHHDITVCSIFVNPTQFNNPDDYKHYPVTIDRDIEALVGAGTDLLFLPSVEEIYPTGHVKKTYDLEGLESVWEGAFRPGHFQGVCQVVERLLDIVEPDTLYLGQKDFQQCMVVRRLLQLMGKGEAIRLDIAPTLREMDGLAMSSRNLRLTPGQRALAPAIARELEKIRASWKTQPPQSLEAAAKAQLAREGFSVDYVAIVRQSDLAPIQGTVEPAVVLAAASLGAVRLIDNLPLD